jgi:hypothetical protein
MKSDAASAREGRGGLGGASLHAARVRVFGLQRGESLELVEYPLVGIGKLRMRIPRVGVGCTRCGSPLLGGAAAEIVQVIQHLAAIGGLRLPGGERI